MMFMIYNINKYDKFTISLLISSSIKTCLTVLVGDLRPTRSRSNTFLFVNKTEVKNCTAILLKNKNKVWFLQHLPSLTSLSSLEYLQTELLCCRLAVVNKATWLCCKLAQGQIQLSSISLYSDHDQRDSYNSNRASGLTADYNAALQHICSI